MKTVLIPLLFILSACKPQQHVWDEIDACKEKYKEECFVMVVPDSKTESVVSLLTKVEK